MRVLTAYDILQNVEFKHLRVVVHVSNAKPKLMLRANHPVLNAYLIHRCFVFPPSPFRFVHNKQRLWHYLQIAPHVDLLYQLDEEMGEIARRIEHPSIEVCWYGGTPPDEIYRNGAYHQVYYVKYVPSMYTVEGPPYYIARYCKNSIF
ncbi:MAG: hypothetical protein D6698_01525 [Gammaproteobacteria bacterium]|nr:MAG: hypothetical protein D6698_01525 [Gammaproteobacteria bacterium]